MAKNLKTYQVAITPDLKEMKGVGRKIGDEVKPGVDEMGVADQKISDISTSLVVAFAAIGVAAAAAFAMAVKGAWDAASAAASYADDMMTMSSVTGISTDALQEFKYMSDLVDVSLETLQGASTKNVKSMYAAAEGSQAASDAYAKLGVNVIDANGNLRDSDTVFNEAIDALSKVTNETERDAIAMQIMGRSARDLNPLIEKGSEKLADLRQEAHDMGAVLDGETLESLGSMQDGLDRITGRMDALKMQVGASFAPMFTVAIDIIVSALGSLGGDISKLPEMMGQVLPEMATYIMEQIPAFLEGGLQLIVALILGIAEALPKLIPTIIDGILDMVDTIITMLPQLLDAGIQLILGLTAGLIEAIPRILDRLPEIIDSLVSFLTGPMLPQVVAGGVQLVLGLAGGLIKAIPQLLTSVPKITESLIRGLVDSIPAIGRAGLELVKGLAQGIAGAGSYVLQAIKDLAFSAIDSFKSFLGIHSPSKVFEELGGFTGEGFGIGLEKSLADVNGMIRAEVSDIESSFTVPKLSTSVTSSFTAPAGGNTFNVYIDGQLVGSSPGIRDSLMALLRDINREKNMGMLPV